MRPLGFALRACGLLLLVALSVTSASARGESPWSDLGYPAFTRIDTRELPEIYITAVAQDTRGFVWVGTADGLARFDGYTFKNYLASPNQPKGLPQGGIHTMLADPRGGLWLGTYAAGFVRYDAASDAFATWPLDRNGRAGSRSTDVNSLALAPDGGLLVGGSGGLDRFDPKTGAFEPLAITTGDQPYVWCVLVDRRGAFWVQTDRGLFYRSPRARGFEAFAPLAGIRNEGGFDLGPSTLFEDSSQRVWVATNGRLFAVDRHRRVVASFDLPGWQGPIAEPAPGTIWSASSKGGISVIDVATQRVRRIGPDPQSRIGLTRGQITAFMLDRSGLLWIAGEGGLLLHNPRNRGLYVLSSTRPDLGLDGRAIADVAASSGVLWVGGGNDRLVGLAPGRPPRGIEVPAPYEAGRFALYADSGGTLWIGTGRGLCRLAPGATRAQCPAGPSGLGNAQVTAMLDDGKVFWVGTVDGLAAQEKATGNVTIYHHTNSPASLSNDIVYDLFKDRQGRVWIGTVDGLNLFDRGRFVRFLNDPRNPNTIGPYVDSIVEDRTGRLWAAAQGQLDILRYVPAGALQLRHLDRTDGLPNDNVDGLAQDPTGIVWANTDNGIAAIDPATLHLRAFGIADGAIGDGYWNGAVTQSRDGTIFFGDLSGVMVIAPGARSAWTYAPPVLLTALKSAHGTTLPAGGRNFTAEFTALDYSAPLALKYAYKLDGYDRDWIATDPAHRSATYTNLPPGAYTLLVRATNRLGVWSDRRLAVRLVAEPAWYETWWFRLLAVALVLLALTLLHRARTAVLRARQRELEAVVEQRTQALKEASLTDPLTGLRNRRFLMQALDDDVALALRRHENHRVRDGSGALEEADLLFFVVDIDRFKAVNDHFGHRAGDEVLVQVTQRLREVLRDFDYLVRWGGEEFLAVARSSRRGDAPEIAERLRQTVANRPFVLESGQPVVVTVSIGFAVFPFLPSHPRALTWAQVVDLADHALYMAKDRGRNAWFGLSPDEGTDPEFMVQARAATAAEVINIGHLRVLESSVRAETPNVRR